MPTSFNILRGNTVTIANKSLTEGLMTIDTDKKKVSVDWDSNGTLERIGFSSGDVTANSNESGSNDLEGLLVGEKGYKVLPIDSDLVLDENDITLSDIIDNKADIDDYGVDLIAKRVMTNLTAPTKNTDPYVYRKTPTAKTDVVDMHKIIGASVVWNQKAKELNTTNWEETPTPPSSCTFNNNTVTFTCSSSYTGLRSTDNYEFISGHKYLVSLKYKATSTFPSGKYLVLSSSNLKFIYRIAPQQTSSYIYKQGVVSVANGETTRLFIWDLRTTDQDEVSVGDIVIIDLTAMFGTTIADYVYSLETQTADTGIAWLQSYGFFTEDYYAYQTNKLESVCVSEKKIGGKNLFDKTNFKFVIGYIDGNGWQGNKTILNYPSDSLGNFWNSVILDISKLRNKSITYSYFNTQAETYRGILDSDFNVLVRIGNSAQNVGTVDLSQYPTAKYLALSFIKSEYNFDNAQIEIGSTATTYEPYAEPSTYSISPITLRGLFGVNNGKLTVDGDEYFANGNVNRNYEQRAYQSGDESLANAITDGTNTVVKLATPTTETTTPFVEIQSDNASATGNPVTVDSERGIMQNAIVDFTPIQDLHGYDSPWVGGGGKNKLKTTGTSQTRAEVSYTVNSDGTVLVNGTANETNPYTVGTLELKGGTSYIISSGANNDNNFYLQVIGEGVASINTVSGAMTFTPNADLTGTVRIVVVNGKNVNNVLIKPMICLASASEPTSFAPYSNICPISGRTQTTVSVNSEDTTIQFGQTVYGGTCDVVNGGTSSTMAIVDLDNLTWTFGSRDRWTTPDLRDVIKKVTGNNQKANIVAEQYETYTTDQLYSDISLIGIESDIQGSIKVRNGSTTETPHGKICYELATPTTINTPANGTYESYKGETDTTIQFGETVYGGATTIPLEKGTNTVTVDDNATISFDYRMRDTFISTEEFVDYGVNQGNRDIAIPCGHDSDYYQCFDLPELPTDNNTYLLTCTVTNGEPNITWERS